MESLNEFLNRHSIIAGIVLIFAFTWPIDLANSGLLPFQVPYTISLTFGWGIGIAALLMTSLTLGKRGVLTLLKRFLIWHVGWKWCLTALFLFPVVFMIAVLLNAAWNQTSIDFSGVFAHKVFGPYANLPTLILPFFLFDLITNGEEMGWRGYVLPRLQAKYSAVVSSLILGVIWAFWHLPKYLAPDNTGSFMLMLIKVLADAVIYTWVYNNTKGSLLLTSILHAAGNTAGVFLPMANTQSGEHMDVYITAIVLLALTATVVTLFTGTNRLSRIEEKQIQEQRNPKSAFGTLFG